MSFLFGGTPFDGYADGRRSLNTSGGGGGGGPTSSTTQTSNIPDWMRPQVETALGAATQQIFNVDQSGNITGFRPYVPYSTKPTDYVAGLSPMQTQAMQSAANLQTPTQFAAGSNLASAAGQGALGTTGAAMGYGGMGAQYGQQGARIGQGALGYGAQGAGYGAQGAGTAATALGYGAGAASIGQEATQAGSNYQSMATNPYAVQAYMNPYVEASLAPQLQLMNQQMAQTQAQNQAQAVKQGAYGGSRQAVQQGLTQQNYDLAKQQTIAQGYNEAFKQAQQAQQFGANLGLQGQQVGIQGQQAALQGVQGAQAGYGLGIQGAQAGLQGIQGALAGTAQGIQGAQAGLAGVQGAQQGYSLANQAAANLGQLGTAQLGAQQGIIGLQGNLGAQQQQYQQALMNQAIQNYATAQQYPQQQLSFYNSLLRGYATPTTTTSTYQASPSPMSQMAGLGMTGAAAYGMMKKKGGKIEAKGDGLEELGMYRAMKGE